MTDAQSQGTKVASTVARDGKYREFKGEIAKPLKSCDNPGSPVSIFKQNQIIADWTDGGRATHENRHSPLRWRARIDALPLLIALSEAAPGRRRDSTLEPWRNRRARGATSAEYTSRRTSRAPPFWNQNSSSALKAHEEHKANQTKRQRTDDRFCSSASGRGDSRCGYLFPVFHAGRSSAGAVERSIAFTVVAGLARRANDIAPAMQAGCRRIRESASARLLQCAAPNRKRGQGRHRFTARASPRPFPARL